MNWDYIAGFIDGEGCFCITSRKRADRPSTNHYAILSITNTDRQVLDDIASFIDSETGCEVFSADKKQSNDGHVRRPCYVLRINGSSIRYVLPHIVYKLYIKHEQAVAMMEFLETVSPIRTFAVTSDVLEKREDLARYISWLNQGKP